MKHLSTILFVFAVVLCCVLMFKKTWGDYSLVGNLEPYPDTIYYSFPAWNLVHGGKFALVAGEFSSKQLVPPVYTLILLPFFAVFHDIRAFYLANMAMMAAAGIFFVMFVRNRLEKSVDWKLYCAIGLMLSGTSFYIYNMPSLLMAEVPSLMLVAMLLWGSNLKNLRVSNLVAATVGVLLFLTKFSNVPILWATLLWLVYRNVRLKKYKELVVPLMAVIIAAGVVYALDLHSGQKVTNQSVGFSGQYYWTNMQFYVRTLLGGATRYLWYKNPFITPLLAYLAVAGFGLLVKRRDAKAGITGLLVAAMVGFMSFFYYPDARYMLLLYPVIIFWAVYSLSVLPKALAAVIVAIILLNPAKLMEIKRQAGLNLRYKETPWHYVASQNFKTFLADKPEAYIGSFLPPYYLAILLPTPLRYVPLSSQQEFVNNYDVSGQIDSLLEKGKDVFVSPYYMTNSLSGWGKDWESLKARYQMVLVADGCLDTCSIYKLSKKL